MVVIPTYNERDNIAPLVEKIQSLGNGLHILFVDDNSPDGTGQLADELSQRCDGIYVIHRQKKLGLGTAYVEGFKFALARGYDYVIQMDADFSHDPKYVVDLLDKMAEFDIVIASRYIHGIRIYNWSFQRLVLSLFANKYFQLVTGMRVNDLSSGFKCFKREVLESIDLDSICSKGFCFQLELPYRSYKKGFKIGEIPIIFYSRSNGYSKLSKKVMFEAFYMVWRLRLIV